MADNSIHLLLIHVDHISLSTIIWRMLLILKETLLITKLGKIATSYQRIQTSYLSYLFLNLWSRKNLFD